jgi:pSer/pThr/pTyr-binding forkhead associated (FHA) protein
VGELTLLVLRIAFLGILWAFVFAVVYALRSDLFGQKVRKLPAQAAAAAAPAPAAAPSRPAPAATPSGGQGIAKRLVITSGAKEGLELDLPGELLTIGRSGESGLVIRDDYTSTHHARLLLWKEGWVVQDLDSTNGTYLDGQRVTTPVLVPLNTPVKIGTTSFELRR